MNKKFITILILIVAIFVIGGAILAWMFLNNPKDVVNTNQPATNKVSNSNGNAANTNAAVNSNSAASGNNSGSTSIEDEIVSLAKSFIDRYGTFSSQNEYDNINDLRTYMTESMNKDADKLIKEIEANNTNGSKGYYGITTRTLSSEMVELKDSEAKLNLTAQRKESSEAKPELNVYYQNVEVIIKKESGVWKVDKVTWL